MVEFVGCVIVWFCVLCLWYCGFVDSLWLFCLFVDCLRCCMLLIVLFTLFTSTWFVILLLVWLF